MITQKTKRLGKQNLEALKTIKDLLDEGIKRGVPVSLPRKVVEKYHKATSDFIASAKKDLGLA